MAKEAQKYLQEKKIYVKPIPKSHNKMIKDPNHVGYFMFNSAFKDYILPADKYGSLVDPFVDLDERNFFEKELGHNLNVKSKDHTYFKKFRIKIIKDENLMSKGLELDMSNPEDVLRYKVLKQWGEFAPSWDERFASNKYIFAFVDEDFEEKKAATNADATYEAYMHFGSMKDSKTKLSKFLQVYNAEVQKAYQIPEDATLLFLNKEVMKVLENDKDMFLKIATDPDVKFKYFINDAIKVGAITKEGRNSYKILGDSNKYMYLELANYIKQLAEEQDDTYLKIEAQIKKK